MVGHAIHLCGGSSATAAGPDPCAAARVLPQGGNRAGRALVDDAPPPADDDRSAAKLGLTQELDRRVERVHVEMGDEFQMRNVECEARNDKRRTAMPFISR